MIDRFKRLRNQKESKAELSLRNATCQGDLKFFLNFIFKIKMLKISLQSHVKKPFQVTKL